jgi:hypothetical protein
MQFPYMTGSERLACIRSRKGRISSFVCRSSAERGSSISSNLGCESRARPTGHTLPLSAGEIVWGSVEKPLRVREDR